MIIVCLGCILAGGHIIYTVSTTSDRNPRYDNYVEWCEVMDYDMSFKLWLSLKQSGNLPKYRNQTQ